MNAINAQLITDKEVAEVCGVSANTIRRWVREGNFPAPIKLGANTTRWKVSAIQEFLDSKSEEAA